MTSVSDVHGMAEELIEVLQSDTQELVHMTEVGTQLEKIRQLRGEQEMQIKKDIAALIALQENEEQNAAVGQSDVTFHNEVEQISRQLTDVKAHKENVTKECSEIKNKIETAKSEEEKILRERERVKHQTTETLPKLRYDVNLYSNITNIRWQYDCEPSLIKGYVSNKNDVRPFSLDSKEYSQFFIANYLWDMMEVDW